MNDVDPPRLREGDDDLARLLRQAHDDLPDAHEMSHIASRLSPPTPWPWGLSPRLLGGLGVAAVLAGLAGLAARPWSAHPVSRAITPSAASEPAPPEASPVISADPGPGEPAASAPAPREPAADAPPDASSPPAARARDAPRRAASVAPVAPVAPVASATPATATSAAPAVDPMLELSLLDQARRKSTSAPAEALALASEHARLFPRSAFGTEREVIVIESLQRSGRTGEAQSRARRFLEASPRSAYRERLERLLR